MVQHESVDHSSIPTGHRPHNWYPCHKPLCSKHVTKRTINAWKLKYRPSNDFHNQSGTNYDTIQKPQPNIVIGKLDRTNKRVQTRKLTKARRSLSKRRKRPATAKSRSSRVAQKHIISEQPQTIQQSYSPLRPTSAAPRRRRPGSAALSRETSDYKISTGDEEKNQRQLKNLPSTKSRIPLQKLAIQSALLSYRHKIPQEELFSRKHSSSTKTCMDNSNAIPDVAIQQTKLLMDQLLGTEQFSDNEVQGMLEQVLHDLDSSKGATEPDYDPDYKANTQLFSSVHSHCETSGTLNILLHPQGQSVMLPDRLSTAVAFSMMEKLEEIAPQLRVVLATIRTVLVPAVYGVGSMSDVNCNNVEDKVRNVNNTSDSGASFSANNSKNKINSTSNNNKKEPNDTSDNQNTTIPIVTAIPPRSLRERFHCDEPHWERIAHLKDIATSERSEAAQLKGLLKQESEPDTENLESLRRTREHLLSKYKLLPLAEKRQVLEQMLDLPIVPKAKLFTTEMLERFYNKFMEQESIPDMVNMRKEAAEIHANQAAMPHFVRSAMLRRKSIEARETCDMAHFANYALSHARGLAAKTIQKNTKQKLKNEEIESNEPHPAEHFLANSLRSLTFPQCQRVLANTVPEFGPEVIYKFIENDPKLEERLLIDCQPVGKLQSFWERNVKRLAQVLYLSETCLKDLMFDHQEVGGKMLECYSQWLLGTGHGQLASFEHHGVLKRLLLLLCREDSAFLQDSMLSDTVVLRSVLESDAFDIETCRTVSRSSPKLYDTVLRAGVEHLPWMLSRDVTLTDMLFNENPNFLNNYFLKHPNRLVEIFRFDCKILPSVLHSDPTLLQLVADTDSELLCGSLARFWDIVRATLEHCDHEALVEVLGGNEKLLIRNKRLLTDLGMWSRVMFASDAMHIGTQTDVIPVRPPPGTEPTKLLLDIVGRKRITVAKSSGTRLPVHQVYKYIAAIYERKLRTDSIDDKAGHTRDALPDTTHDLFLELYPDNVLTAKKALAKFCVTLIAICTNQGIVVNQMEQSVQRRTSRTSSIGSVSSTIHLRAVDLRVKWFAIMNGVHDPDSYNPKSIEVLLNLLTKLLPENKVESVLSSTFVFVDFTTIIATTQQVLVALWASDAVIQSTMEGLALLPNMRRQKWKELLGLQEKDIKCLERRGSSNSTVHSQDNQSANAICDKTASDAESSSDESDDVQNVRSTGTFVVTATLGNDTELLPQERSFVNLDEAIDVVMSSWRRSDAEQTESLVTLFHESDTNGDGILDFGEFRDMVNKVDPNIDERTVLRMFKLTGEETESGEKAITPGQFVSLMQSHFAAR